MDIPVVRLMASDAERPLVTEQDDLLAASPESAGQQRQIASALAEITAETVDTAASAIGRVAANAVTVKFLARQV